MVSFFFAGRNEEDTDTSAEYYGEERGEVRWVNNSSSSSSSDGGGEGRKGKG